MADVDLYNDSAERQDEEARRHPRALAQQARLLEASETVPASRGDISEARAEAVSRKSALGRSRE